MNIPPGFTLRQTLRGHALPICAMTWSNDGHRLASAGADRAMVIWDVATGAQLPPQLRPESTPLSVAWSPDGTLIASGGEGSDVRLWRVPEGVVEARLVPGGDVPSLPARSWVNAVAWSKDGRTLAVAHSDGVLRLWQSTLGTPVWQERAWPFGSRLTDAAWSPDSKLLAVGVATGEVHVLERDRFEAIRVLTDPSASGVLSVAWYPGGKSLRLASTHNDGSVRIWGARSGRRLAALAAHGGEVNSASFSSGGEVLATFGRQGASGEILLWRCDGWARLAALTEPRPVGTQYGGLAFSPRRPWLATLAEGDCAIRIWELDLPTVLGAPPATGLPLNRPIRTSGRRSRYDVFFSYNRKDESKVRALAEAIKARGLNVWLDVWELAPGQPWQEALETIIRTTRSAAVCVGADGLGPWEVPEMRGCLTEFVTRRLPVIPVLLPGAAQQPDLPLFLKQFNWLDLRGGVTEDGLDRLEWGITGRRPRPDTPVRSR